MRPKFRPLLPIWPLHEASRSTPVRYSRSPERSGPEALGSPAGYVVPQGHCLLWPHPRLSTSPVDLWINTTGLCLMPRPRASPVYSACPSVRATSRTPADRAAAGNGYLAARSSLRQLRMGSASALPRQSVRAWPCIEAAEFALCCGPDSCSPFTDKGFYFRAFAP